MDTIGYIVASLGLALVLGLSSRAVRDLRRRQGPFATLMPANAGGRNRHEWGSEPRPAPSASAVRMLGVAALGCTAATVFVWGVGGFPLVGILLGAFAICFTAMRIAGWRERRRLERPPTPPVVAVVDEGRLRFGPATDGLIRDI